MSNLKLGILMIIIVSQFVYKASRIHQFPVYSVHAKIQSKLDSGYHKYLKVAVYLSNNTNDTLKYITWVCGPNFIFMTDTDRLKVDMTEPVNCAEGLPRQLILAPFSVKKNIVYLRVLDHTDAPVNFRIGVKIIKDEGNNGWCFVTGRKYNSIIVWSNQMKLSK